MSIPAAERKAVLDLFPYFSSDPIIFDVGSNKGDFSALFAGRSAEMHLFEPNEIFLHYSMVRFCEFSNICYCTDALSNEQGVADFIYFTNGNNGLSNIIGNDKWDDLPWKKKQVNTSTLDIYCKVNKVNKIDLLKIDVEGADLWVLEGSRGMLKNKAIKFIQVEYAEHIEVTGRKFSEIISFLDSFGYKSIPTNDMENVIFADKNFTQDWNSEFKKNTANIPKFNFALEIGCFEGLTSNYICDNLLTDGGRMICVDPLTDEYLPWHKDNAMFVGQYDRFIRNTHGKPIELMRMPSREAYPILKDYRFQFIYIDGDHTEAEVFNDGVKCWEVLLEGGYMLFDDYGQSEETKRGIDRFLESQKGNFDLIEKSYQVLIQRIDWRKRIR
jgi:FkbM family methyltransferase